MTVRVVLDTNILLSALITPEGTSARLIRSWLESRYTLVSHDEQIEEIRDVSRRAKMRRLFRPFEAGNLINIIRERAVMPLALPKISRSPDPDDDFLLALCEAGRADWLVTGDKRDLLALKSHGGTRIATAAAFAQQLRV